jgi:hypothetical protein
VKVVPEALRWAERVIARLREGLRADTAGPSLPKKALPPQTRSAGSCWQPREWAGRIGGFQLSEGMLYVGSGLAGLSRWRAPVEPALVDPNLPVAGQSPDHLGQSMTYWPSYSNIPPACRAAYLAWLAGGRSEPAANIGYVFLFFYGIERRVLVDALPSPAVQLEIAALLDEVRRLLGLYGGNRSFRGYATSFLHAAQLLHQGVDPTKLAFPSAATGEAVWLDLKIVLGTCAARGTPVAAEWALAWLKLSPELSHRTVIQRCPQDFAQLFLLRYREAFGSEGGIELKRGQGQARLSVPYRPASPSFDRPISLPLPDVPDVDLVILPPELRDLGHRVLEELAHFSRWVGRSGDPHGIKALAYLPAVLWPSRESTAILPFLSWIEAVIEGSSHGVVSGAELAAHWSLGETGRVRRADVEILASFLAAKGYGLEPDGRQESFFPAKLTQLVFFRLPPGMHTVSKEAGGDALTEAEAVLSLATTITEGKVPLLGRFDLGDGTWFSRRWELSGLQLARMEAKRRGWLAAPPSLLEVKKHMLGFDDKKKAELASALASLAHSNGQPESGELEQLGRAYRLLGLQEKQLYSDLHALIGAGSADESPILIVESGASSPGFSLPPRHVPPGAPPLDSARIRQKLMETEQLQNLLASIFDVGEDEITPAANPPPDAYSLLGLDASHSALLRFLLSRAVWERRQVEQMTRVLGLLPDGALEVINEAAFNAFGEAVVEGDDPVEVRIDLIGERER